MRTILLALLALAAFGLATQAARSQDRPRSEVGEDDFRNWRRASAGAPCSTPIAIPIAGNISYSNYPFKALRSLTAGEALVVFDVEDGTRISNARVIAAAPAGVFESTALRLLKYYRLPRQMGTCRGMRSKIAFYPRRGSRGEFDADIRITSALPPISAAAALMLEQNEPKSRCGENTIRLDGRSPRGALSHYPTRAYDHNIGGVAILRLSIGVDGAALNPEIIEVWPAGQDFDRAALAVAGLLRYPPRETICEGAVVEVVFG